MKVKLYKALAYLPASSVRPCPDVTSARPNIKNTHHGQGLNQTSSQTQNPSDGSKEGKSQKERSYLPSHYRPSERHLFDQERGSQCFL